jgi:hypothetical protein
MKNALSRHQARPIFPPKRWLAITELQGFISQKIEIFITTAVRTSNPTQIESVCEQDDKKNILIQGRGNKSRMEKLYFDALHNVYHLRNMTKVIKSDRMER